MDKIRNITKSTLLIGRFHVQPNQLVPDYPLTNEERNSIERYISLGKLKREIEEPVAPVKAKRAPRKRKKKTVVVNPPVGEVAGETEAAESTEETTEEVAEDEVTEEVEEAAEDEVTEEAAEDEVTEEAESEEKAE